MTSMAKAIHPESFRQISRRGRYLQDHVRGFSRKRENERRLKRQLERERRAMRPWSEVKPVGPKTYPRGFRTPK